MLRALTTRPLTRSPSRRPFAWKNSTTYTVTVNGAIDLLGDVMTSPFSWSFTTAAPPTVVATTPVSGTSGVALTPTLTATFSDDVVPGSFSFVLVGPNDEPVASTVTYNASTGIATLIPLQPLAYSTTYVAEVSGAQDAGGTTMPTAQSWSFTTAAPNTTRPTVVSQSPAPSARAVALASNVTATFSEDVQASTIHFALTDTGDNTIPATVTYDVLSRTLTLDPTSNLAPASTYTVTLSGAQDLSGNVLTPVSWSFTTAAGSATPPAVTSQTPAAGATGVAIVANLSATFSEQVQATTISFVLTSGGNPVPASVTYDPATETVTLDPSSPLAPSTTYSANLTGAQDLFGNKMATASWSFTTEAVNSTAPALAAQTPASSAANVPLGSDVTATFTEAVQPSTISFVLMNGSTPVTAAVSYDVASHAVFLDPSANLAPGTTYTATLSGARDLAGNTMTSTSWTFTTVAPTTAPTIAAQNPGSGAIGVPIASNITATFSGARASRARLASALKNGSNTVSSAVTYDLNSLTITLDPTANLAAGTTYTATLSGAKDLAGDTMTSTSWSFTTSVADTTAPTISTRTPASGATSILIPSNVTATFSEDVVPSTITFVLKNGATSVVLLGCHL